MIEKAQKKKRGINVNRKLQPDTGRGRRARGVVCCAELIVEDEAGKQKPPSLGLWQLGSLQSLERKKRLSRGRALQWVFGPVV